MISDYFLLTAISIQLSMFLSLTKCSDWDYHQNGPDVWQDFDQMCASSSQSPINIKTVCAVYKSFNQFNFSETYNMSQNFSLNFNKHSINGSLIDQEEYPLHLTGGGLNGIYKFVNFHLHWGENYASGSEHEVNGEKFTGEVHLVHQNIENGHLAVLGFFIEAERSTHTNSTETHERRRRDTQENSENSTAEWDQYFSVAQTLTDPANSTKIQLNLMKLIGSDLTDFWRYTGSLTTPPCSENVTWTVFTQSITIDDEFIEMFREHILPRNFRPPQLINGRTIYRSFLNVTKPSISDYQCCLQSNGIQISNAIQLSNIGRKIMAVLLLIPFLMFAQY